MDPATITRIVGSVFAGIGAGIAFFIGVRRGRKEKEKKKKNKGD